MTVIFRRIHIQLLYIKGIEESLGVGNLLCRLSNLDRLDTEFRGPYLQARRYWRPAGWVLIRISGYSHILVHLALSAHSTRS